MCLKKNENKKITSTIVFRSTSTNNNQHFPTQHVHQPPRPPPLSPPPPTPTTTPPPPPLPSVMPFLSCTVTRTGHRPLASPSRPPPWSRRGDEESDSPSRVRGDRKGRHLSLLSVLPPSPPVPTCRFIRSEVFVRGGDSWGWC